MEHCGTVAACYLLNHSRPPSVFGVKLRMTGDVFFNADEDELQEERVHAGARLCHEHAGKPFADLLSPGDAIMCQLLA